MELLKNYRGQVQDEKIMVLCNHRYHEECRSDGMFMRCDICDIEVYSSAYPVYMWNRMLQSKEGRKLTKRLFGRRFARRFYSRVK